MHEQLFRYLHEYLMLHLPLYEYVSPERFELLAEAVVGAGFNRLETAHLGGIGKEGGEMRLVVDQQQTRLRRHGVPNPSRIFTLKPLGA